jgi:signal transduction histidine kinase
MKEIGPLGVLVLTVVGLWRHNRRTRREPCGWLTPSRLDAHQSRLVDAFTPLHEQAGQALQATGMTLVWSPGAGVGTLRLSADTTQGLLLIARDALDEVLHQASRPSQVRLELDLLRGETGSHLRMAVIDTGRAIPRSLPQSPSVGHELSMAQRHATQLGAQLDISADATGWCVEVVLQLAPA